MNARSHTNPSLRRLTAVVYPALATTTVLLALSLGLAPIADAGEEPPALSGTIEYTGGRGPVSAERPILVFLSTLPNLDGAPVAGTLVTENGGAFELIAPAPGTYYLGYLLDTNGDMAPALGDPFGIYLDRTTVPADPLTVPQSGLVLSFDDTGGLPGVHGSATYTGDQGPVSSDVPIRIELFLDAELTDHLDLQQMLFENGAPYEFILLDTRPHYMLTFLDLSNDGDLDVGEPFTIYDDKSAPPGDPVPQEGGAVVDISFGDEVVVIPTPTGAVTETPTAIATETPTAGDTPTPGLVACVGDCNDDGQVTINELILGVTMGLGEADLSDCPAFDNDGSGTVTVDELLTAVNNGLLGCP